MRLFRILPAALTAATLVAGCAHREVHPRDPEVGFETGHAVGEVREMPGTVRSRRGVALEGQMIVTVAAPDSATAQRALDAAVTVADSLDRLLGRHYSGSEVYAINAAAGREAVRVSPWTEAIVAAALHWAERTGGAFDPTIGPVVELWGFGPRETTEFPDERRLAEAMALVGWRKVRHDPAAHTVFLTEPGMTLDLRAASKGFALDRMREAVLGGGATSAVLELGGDHMFVGPGPERHEGRWPVELPDPYDPGRAFAAFEVSAGAISTTTPYARTVEIAGRRVGHLIDPRTGRPVTTMASATVFAPEALVSDILSTALFVIGASQGCDLMDDWDEVGAVLVVEPSPGQQARVCVTPGLRGQLGQLQAPFRPLQTEDL
ncbi:MAG TPA: FAD:protein FMN transferase [Gemmatimonadota bacterium]|nr:FAD:protein FMN transferase [Gemmatimonadota bacterium]